jgi:hypothetical protein
MSFVNRDVQQAFFQVLQFRREKRVVYGAEIHQSLNGVLFFDKCLDIISCHDPKIWSRGTGNLLIAPSKQKILTLPSRPEDWRYQVELRREKRVVYGAQVHQSFNGVLFFDRCLNMILIHPSKKQIESLSPSRAEDWRYQASREHFFIDFYESLEDKVFGYFARRTLEYIDRMRIFQHEAEEEDEIFSEDDIEIFEYLDNMTHQFESLSIQSDLSRRAGIRRYGLLFDNDRNASKCYTDYHIFDEIKASMCNPSIEALRDLLIDMYPLFFINVDDTETEEYRNYFEDQEDDLQFVNHICDFQTSEGECVVCYEEGKVIELKCHASHTLCNSCIYKIISRGTLCPICRQDIFSKRE